MAGGGLQSVAQQLQSYGRGPDTMLAHISPDEARFIDSFQGGRRSNPLTGLPEYGALGKVLKGLVRAAGAIGGFIASGGNPLGAAAGAGIATKLTGGSWKQAGVGAALGGLGAGVGNLAGGVGFMGGGVGATSAASAAGYPAFAALPGGTGAGIAGSMGAGSVGGLGGLGAGMGGFLGEPREQMVAPGMPAVAPDNITYNPNQPVRREYVPYTGDLSKYGESGGEHNFYRPIKPIPVNVDGISIGDNHPAQTEFMARGGKTSLHKAAARRASRSAMSPAARAGAIRGPGDGQSDDIPAMLSDSEHVIDAGTSAMAGNGSADAGHRVMENIKQEIRRQAGVKNPKRPLRKIDNSPPSVSRMVLRAKRKAGVS